MIQINQKLLSVDVIIPTYNRLDLLKRAIESVRLQTYTNWKLIVVDDCSDEPIASYVESLNDQHILCIRHEVNRGVSAARNTGIEAATGDWIAFLDSDNYWNQKN